MPDIRLDTANVRHLSTFREHVGCLGRERPSYVLFPYPSQKKLSGSRELISSTYFERFCHGKKLILEITTRSDLKIVN